MVGYLVVRSAGDVVRPRTETCNAMLGIQAVSFVDVWSGGSNLRYNAAPCLLKRE